MTRPLDPQPPRPSEPAIAIATAEAVDASSPRRVSWGAIFAGALIAIALQMLLNLLGLGIGLATLEPGGDAPGGGLALGAILWWALSGFAALFVGGAVAGRLAGSPTHVDGALHGVTVWAVATAFAMYLVASSFGALVSGTLGIVGNGIGAVGSAAAANIPSLADEIDRRIDLDRETWTDVRAELEEILRQTNKDALQPENIEARASDIADQAGDRARAAAQRPGAADGELRSLVRRATGFGQELVDAADEEAAVNLLVARTDMTEAEAAATIDRWQSQFDDAQQRIEAWTQSARNSAVDVVDETGDIAAGAALGAFLVLLIGASAGAIGGATGAPEDREHRAV